MGNPIKESYLILDRLPHKQEIINESSKLMHEAHDAKKDQVLKSERDLFSFW